MRESSKFRNNVLETLWKNPLMGLAVFDPEHGALRDANDAFLDLLDSRYRTRKTLGTPASQCMPDFELSGLHEAFQRTVKTGMPVHADALRLHRGANAVLTLNCLILPVGANGAAPGQAGRVEALLLVATERKTELPVADPLNLVDSQTRHALALRFHLSAREIDIVGECLQGKKNRQIAHDLHIGISTVKRHLESAYRKIGIGSSRSLPLAVLKVIRGMNATPNEVELTPDKRDSAAA